MGVTVKYVCQLHLAILGLTVKPQPFYSIA